MGVGDVCGVGDWTSGFEAYVDFVGVAGGGEHEEDTEADAEEGKPGFAGFEVVSASKDDRVGGEEEVDDGEDEGDIEGGEEDNWVEEEHHHRTGYRVAE